jgi:hypothetical protein
MLLGSAVRMALKAEFVTLDVVNIRKDPVEKT